MKLTVIALAGLLVAGFWAGPAAAEEHNNQVRRQHVAQRWVHEPHQRSGKSTSHSYGQGTPIPTSTAAAHRIRTGKAPSTATQTAAVRRTLMEGAPIIAPLIRRQHVGRLRAGCRAHQHIRWHHVWCLRNRLRRLLRGRGFTNRPRLLRQGLTDRLRRLLLPRLAGAPKTGRSESVSNACIGPRTI